MGDPRRKPCARRRANRRDRAQGALLRESAEPTLWAIRAENRVRAGVRIDAIAHRVRSYENRRSPPCGRSAQENVCARACELARIAHRVRSYANWPVGAHPVGDAQETVARARANRRDRAQGAHRRESAGRSPPCGRFAQETGWSRVPAFPRIAHRVRSYENRSMGAHPAGDLPVRIVVQSCADPSFST